MAAADNKLIEDGALDFSQRLHSELPLRHFGEFHDLDKLAKVVKVQKRNVFANVFDRVWPREKEEIVSLIKKLNHRMDKEVIVDWVTKNREHEVRSVSFLQKYVDLLCENFNEALEHQVLLNPNMEIESLKNYVEIRKQIITNVFDSIWKPGTSQKMQEERKSKLEKHLKAKEEEMLEKQKHNLECKSAVEGKVLLGEVGAVLLERSRQLKSYVNKHQGRTSKNILKGMVEEMLQYLLTGKGKMLKESHEGVYKKLVELLEDEVRCLGECSELVGYAETFEAKLRSYCFGTESGMNETRDVQQPDPLRQITLQAILNEFKEEGSSKPVRGTHGEAYDNHGSSIQADEGEMIVMHMEVDEKTSAGPKTRISRRRRQFTKVCDSNEVPEGSVGPAKASPEQSSKRTHDKRKDNHEMEDSLSERMKKMPRKVVSKAKTSTSDKCPTRRSARSRSRNSNEKARGLSVNSRKRREAFVAKMKTKNDEEFQIEDCETNRDDEKPVQGKPSSSKTSGKTLKGRSMDKAACPNKITVLQGDQLKYQCNVCKMKFRFRDSYLFKYHGDFCNEKNWPHICTECGKCFSQISYLTSHRHTHTDERPLKCPKCPIGFKQSGDLARHMRIHTGEKRYKCTKCEMRFLQLCNLKAHLRAHDRGTSFNCEACNVHFVSAQAFHNHNLTHKEKLPIVCIYCKRRFDKMDILKNHVVIHSGERPFHCPTCTISSTTKFNLVRHLKRSYGHPAKVATKLANDAALDYLIR